METNQTKPNLDDPASDGQKEITRKEQKRRARKKWTSESLDRKRMFDEMRTLLPVAQAGKNIRSIEKSNGELLNYAERATLLRLLPLPDHVKTGRIVNMVGGQAQDAGYHCPFNLAGRLYVVTLDGYVVHVPFHSSGVDCGHSACSGRDFLRVGGKTDSIVMVLPRKQLELPAGVMSVEGAGTKGIWDAAYRSAIFAVHLAKANLPFPKYRALLGHKFIPRSLFGEVCVFMARMFGLQEVGFFHYFDKADMMDALVSGEPGSSDEFSAHMVDTFGQISERMSNYAWGLTHLCQLQAISPNASIPFVLFLRHINKMSRETTRLFQLEYVKNRGDLSKLLSSRSIPNVDSQLVKKTIDDELMAEERRVETESRANIISGSMSDVSQLFSRLRGRERTALLFELNLLKLVADVSDLDLFNDMYAQTGKFPVPLSIDFRELRDDIKFSRYNRLIVDCIK